MIVNSKKGILSIFFIFIFLISFSSALERSPWDYIQEGSINNSYTTINNTYINQTVNATVNSTQFDSNSPIHIKESWLTSFINGFNFLTGNIFNQELNTTSDVTFNNVNFTGLIYGNGSQLTGIAGGSQSTWTSDIDGNGYNLSNVSKVIIGSATDDNSGANLQVTSAGTMTVTVDDIVSGGACSAVEGNMFTGDGSTISFDVYAYKIVSGIKVYSTNAYNIQCVLPSDYNTYDTSLSWDAVSGVTGYKIIYTYYGQGESVTGTSYLWDGFYDEGATNTPSSPYDVSLVAISAPSGISTTLVKNTGGNLIISAPSDETGDYFIQLDADRIDITGGIFKNGNPYAITNPLESNLFTGQYNIIGYDILNSIAYPLQIQAGDDEASAPTTTYIRGGRGINGSDITYGAISLNGNDDSTTALDGIAGAVLVGRSVSDDDGIHELQVDGRKTVYYRDNPMYIGGIFINIEFVTGTLIPSGQPSEAYWILPYFESPLGRVYTNTFQTQVAGNAPEDSDIYITWNDINFVDTYDGIRIVRLLNNSYIDLAYDATSFTASPSTNWTADAVYEPTSRTYYNKSALFSGDVDVVGNIVAYNATLNDITPSTDNTYSFGSSILRWLKGWFVDLDVSGTSLFQGQVTINNSLNVIGNINQTNGNTTINEIYGEMYYHNYTGTSLTFAVAETYYPLFAVPNGEYNNGFTIQGGFNQTSNLTAQYDGVYDISYSSEGDGQNNHEYHLVIFVNGTEIEKCETMHKMSAGGDVVSMDGRCFYRLYAGDVIDLRVADYTGAGSGNYYGMNLNLVRIGN